jgi:signal peptidase I
MPAIGRKTSEFVEFVRTIGFAGALAALIHSFLFAPYWVPTGSMVPTLLVGDYLLVNKFAYGYSRFSLPFAPPLFSGRILGRLPKRGDVVVFRPPGLPDEAFVKRVIGLPGDTIEVVGGQLLVNGAKAARQPVGEYVDTSSGGPVPTILYSETLPNGRRHAILKETDGPELAEGIDANNTPIYTVPAGDLFMMGDNRDDSEDSRFLDGPVGYVPLANVIGPAVLIMGSMDLSAPGYQPWSWPREIRWRRLFQPVR